MRHSFLALIGVIFMAGCSANTAVKTAANNGAVETHAEKKARLLASDSVVTGVAANKLGKETEFIIAQNMVFNLHSSQARSENAHQCEAYAGRFPADAMWLAVCDAALSEAGLSVQNRKASLFNKALILGSLDRTQDAKTVLLSLAAEYPDFAEPHFELARLSYIADDYDAVLSHAAAAIDRGLPRAARAHTLLGIAHEYHQDFGLARASYQAALARNSANATSRRKLARLNRLWPAGQ